MSDPRGLMSRRTQRRERRKNKSTPSVPTCRSTRIQGQAATGAKNPVVGGAQDLVSAQDLRRTPVSAQNLAVGGAIISSGQRARLEKTSGWRARSGRHVRSSRRRRARSGWRARLEKTSGRCARSSQRARVEKTSGRRVRSGRHARSGHRPHARFGQLARLEKTSCRRVRSGCRVSHGRQPEFGRHASSEVGQCSCGRSRPTDQEYYNV